MKIISDLHIHSRYSRACSKELTLPNIAVWCAKKGIGLVGTGDFTYPAWFSSMEKELVSHDSGFYALRQSSVISHKSSVFFVPTAEISCIYTRGGKGRRVHIIIIAPDPMEGSAAGSAITCISTSPSIHGILFFIP